MTDLIKKALNTAYDQHNGQIRKVDKCPYIIHPLEVFSIACRFTDDEVTLAAALLHDTIEDTDYTAEQLKADFGDEVWELVSLLTEDKSLSWKERKRIYIKTLADSGNQKAALVSSSDKINNLESILDTHVKIGDEIWSMFNAPLGDQIEFYAAYYENLHKLLPDGINARLARNIEKLRATQNN